MSESDEEDFELFAMTISAGEVSEGLGGIDRLAEIQQQRAIAPGVEQAYPSMDFCKASIQAGKALCSQWESQLVQLEAGLNGYIKNLRSSQVPDEDSETSKEYFYPIEAQLESYKDLLLDIIIQQASRSQGTPSVQDTPFWHGKEFVKWHSPTCQISELLSVSPGCEDMSSTTIYSERAKLSSSSGPMLVELSAQMAARQQDGERLLTHQGLLWDGLIAVVYLLDVARPEDLFKAHKTSLGHVLYCLPGDRAPFVHHMVELLQCHERHFELFKCVLDCDVYVEDTATFEAIFAEKLGKIGPDVFKGHWLRARLQSVLQG